MKIRYLGISEIKGPLVVLEHVRGVCFDELAELELKNGEIRRGRVIELAGDRAVIQVFEGTNEIALDKSLGKGFCIGHSYFCGRKDCTEEWLHAVVDYDILPMLREYWFDETNKLQRWENILQGVFQS